MSARLLGFVGMLGVLLFMPSEALAQCDERCVDAHDEEGNHIGFGCVTGGIFINCEATVSSCSLDGCTMTSISVDDGTTLAIIPCETLDGDEQSQVSVVDEESPFRVDVSRRGHVEGRSGL